MDSKKYLAIFLVSIFFTLILLFLGCKKGEDDPFFSIYTRNARLTGNWTVDSYLSEIKRTSSEMDTITVTTTQIFDTENWERLIRVPDSGWEKELKGEVFRYRVEFHNNGRMTSYYNYQYVDEDADEDGDEVVITTVNVKEEIKGTWNFLAAADDYKFKERLAIVIEDIKTVVETSILTLTDDDDDDAEPAVPIYETEVSQYKFANGEMSTIYSIRMLKNKEMILEQNINAFEIFRQQTPNFYDSNFTAEEGHMTMTLVKN